MKDNHYVTPEQVIKDEEDGAVINGVFIRKGTMAAAIKNAHILDDPEAGEYDKKKALEYLKDIIPKLNKSCGMDKVLSWKNKDLNNL
ncbi:hypothetical protein [Francisella sp. 19X1-34]|uniref:hypothetical protein n=1 Tax=Francisella sp. 19X1-34 TaxID=3087177 RepID=UPI002E37741E|nr:hypothetical protein [Francisella sp. 19X1-34]MED7789424.1 hypothetical protein [Francisella sp. 19X1-34]